MILELLGCFLALQAEDAVTVTGTVKLANPPARTKIDLSRCRDCAAAVKEEILSQEVMTDKDGNLQGAFVFVRKGLAGKFDPPKEPVTVKLKAGGIEPASVAVQAGQEVVFVNEDNHLHVVVMTGITITVNEGVGAGKKLSRILKSGDLIELKDSVHPWVKGWILVRDHPFVAVTDATGKYELKGLPPGKYTIAVSHGLYKTVTEEIEVQAKESRTLDLTLKEKK